MLHAVALLAFKTEEHSKTAFYILGSVFAAWAVVVSALGLSRADFPGTAVRARLVMGVSLVLAAGSMAAAVATS
jgi:hypothetical protein